MEIYILDSNTTSVMPGLWMVGVEGPPEEGLVFSALLPSGRHWAPVFLIKCDCNLAPLTLLTQGPETVQSLRTDSITCFQHHLPAGSTRLGVWVAELRADCRESEQTRLGMEATMRGPHSMPSDAQHHHAVKEEKQIVLSTHYLPGFVVKHLCVFSHWIPITALSSWHPLYRWRNGGRGYLRILTKGAYHLLGRQDYGFMSPWEKRAESEMVPRQPE